MQKSSSSRWGWNLKTPAYCCGFLHLIKWEAPVFRHSEKPFLANCSFLICWMFEAELIPCIGIFYTYRNCHLPQNISKLVETGDFGKVSH